MEGSGVIGRERLRDISHQIAGKDSHGVCRGHFVLQVQRLLYGSERVALPEHELAEIMRYLRSDAEKTRSPS